MKRFGEKVLGLFVVSEEDEVTKEEAELIEVETSPPLPSLHGKGDDMKKVVDLIASLPDTAPLEVKRAIVVASLEAFGIRVDGVIASAAKAEHALDARAVEARRTMDKVIAEGQGRITELEARIAETKKVMERALTEQQEAAKAVARDKARLRGIGAFFGKS